MKVKVITDSAADLPKDFAAAHDISVVPMSIAFGTDTYEDGVDITTEEFYKKLSQCTSLPKTSQVNEFSFSEVLRPHKDANTLVVIITISTTMSSTYNSAEHAIASLGMQDQTLLINSELVTFAEGVFVIEAVKIIERGGLDKEGIRNALESLKKRIRLYAMIGDLKYLKYGGRLSASSMMVATMLHIHPIITIKDKVDVESKQIGVAKSIRYMIDKAKRRDDNFPVYFGGSNCLDQVLSFKEKSEKELGISGSDMIFSLGPTVGTHAGPGCFGICFIEKE